MPRIGMDVSILAEPGWTGVERTAAGLVRALGELVEEADLSLYSQRPVRLPFPLPPWVRPRPLGGPSRLALWRETTLAPALKRDGIAVLHSPVAAVPYLTRVPRIATIHEVPWLRHPGIEGRWREAVYRARIRAAARVAVRLLVPSEAVARDLRAFIPGSEEKVRVHPFGVEDIFKPIAAGPWSEEVRRHHSLPPGPVVLFVGRPRRKKNLPALVAAVSLLRREMRPAPELVLAGVGAREVPAGPGVCALGFVTDADLVRLYNLASVLAYPSLSEGFGLPPLEAMACGTPVVATNAGSVPEVVQDAALLVDPDSPTDIARALRSAILDSDVRRDLTVRGRHHVRGFAWPGVAERALALMGSVAA